MAYRSLISRRKQRTSREKLVICGQLPCGMPFDPFTDGTTLLRDKAATQASFLDLYFQMTAPSYKYPVVSRKVRASLFLALVA